MNERKQKQLLDAVRAAAPPQPPPNFSASVLRAVARDERHDEALSLFDQLSGWFPRLATAALVVMAVALAFNLYFDGDLILQLAEVSDQWLLPVDWL